ncbi:type II toxin-antitoxin system VapC family toxin [Candidatus Woesearchaeota archaeon]|nr:type II toxin-antitoxin system VapC family toxin [Candidatus Woesearchaeota archaeon]
MTYLDANIFLYAVLNEGILGQKSRALLSKIAKKETVGYTSCLTWDEFVYTLKKLFGREAAVDQGDKLLHFLNLHFLPTNELVLSEAQQLIEKYTLDPRDSIHIASALVHNIPTIVSTDPDFDKVKEITRVSLG